ncbi:phosphoribosyltransferase family protein [Thermosynechococcaceae cyanobacterium BACA0444]|uniref:Phosphoribosyltransferase family protein n=1 Tax=Pseudocalidococcus azoricus BACA0444 TaxID=2918990 RepID=A0AAE4FR38_9CYAN|nr:phosphoribosyltransferase family protein [Pseudocalidococcus azoricus]MDS3860600.1 phosphoribosyltransferase family protein [Pseudocalidococcus azoricus BACA0444]
MFIFRDRADAGQHLAQQLLSLKLDDPTILAIPRGGILVGVPVAQALKVGLGVVITRRLTCARFPELGFGALGEGQIQVLDPASMNLLHITPAELKAAQAKSEAEIEQRQHLFRQGHPLPNLSGKTVIIVDDGLATGLSAKAAIEVVKAHNVKRIILATPVASPQTLGKLRPKVDQIVCVAERPDLRCVGEWYQDFNPNLTDTEVLTALAWAQPHPN